MQANPRLITVVTVASCGYGARRVDAGQVCTKVKGRVKAKKASTPTRKAKTKVRAKPRKAPRRGK